MKDADYDHVGRRLRTLEQCALYRRTLRLTCPRWRHVRVFDAVALWWLFHRRGWNDGLSAMAQRLRCSRCDKQRHVTRPRIVIGRDEPTGEQPPYPDTATWKRLVSRYR